MHIQKASTKEQTKKILTPLSPEWEPFIVSMFTHLCPRVVWVGGDTEVDASDCDGSFRLAKNILASQFPEMDIGETLRYFRSSRWFCDCAVMRGCPIGLGVDPLEDN